MAAVFSTILFLLKILAIVLVCLLVLVILLLCLILFAPISLRVRVVNEEAFSANGSVSWLGVVLRAVFSYEEEFDLAVKVFGIQVYPKKEKKEKQSRPQREAAEEPSAEAAQPVREETDAPPEEPDGTVAQPQEAGAPQKGPAAGGAEKRRGKAKTHKEKKRRPRQHVSSAGKEPGMLEKVRTLVGDEDFGYAVSKVFSELGTLLGSIRIYELKGQAVFSAGSPDLTGMVTGALSLCPACCGNDLDLSPDFVSEEARFRGTLAGGGSLKLIHVVIAAVRLLTDKKLKKIVHLAQNTF